MVGGDGFCFNRGVHLPQQLQERVDAGFVEQGSMKWIRDTWARHVGEVDGVGEVLGALPDTVDRRGVAVEVQAALGEGNVVGAFCAVMVWGYGTNGRGPFKVNRILRGEAAPDLATIGSRLTRALEVTRGDGPVEGFRYLHNADRGYIKFLGPAFFTKWLSLAASADPYGRDTAPIFDSLVQSWIAREADTRLRLDKTAGYEAYLGLLAGWSAATGWSQTQLESTIFRLEREARRTARG